MLALIQMTAILSATISQGLEHTLVLLPLLQLLVVSLSSIFYQKILVYRTGIRSP